MFLSRRTAVGSILVLLAGVLGDHTLAGSDRGLPDASPRALRSRVQGATVSELRQRTEDLKVALAASAATDLNELEQNKAKTQIEGMLERINTLKAEMETAEGEKEQEAADETDPRTKAQLLEELERIKELLLLTNAQISLLEAAIANIATLTKAQLKELIEIVQDVGTLVTTIVETLTGVAKATIKAAADLVDTAVDAAVDVLGSFLDGLTKIGRKLRDFFGGLFSMSCATDLSEFGQHTILLGEGDSFLMFRIPSLSSERVHVPVEELTLVVTVEAGVSSDLRRIVVDASQSSLTLGSFTAGKTVVSSSALTMSDDVTWTGIYGVTSGSLCLTLGGEISNDQTTAGLPLVFGLQTSGSLDGATVVGGIVEAIGGVTIPTVSAWGLIILTLLGMTAGTVILGRTRRPDEA